jgi:hypothetical protein
VLFARFGAVFVVFEGVNSINILLIDSRIVLFLSFRFIVLASCFALKKSFWEGKTAAATDAVALKTLRQSLGN